MIVKTVAITSNTSWYLFNFRKNTILALLQAGYQVFAIAPKDDYSDKLAALGCTFIPISIDQGGTNPLKDLRTMLGFWRLYVKHRPDMILNFTPKNNIYSTLAASQLTIPCINNIAGLGFLFINESLSSKIARQLYKFSQPKAKKIFFQNEDDRSLFIEHELAPKSLTDRLPGSGVDLTRFKISHAEDDGVVRFILIARMLFDKGIKEYVDAAEVIKKKYTKTEFRLLGFLDMNNPTAITQVQMDEWVAEGFVDYLGTSDAVENEIAKVDCVVLPSTYREGVPKSLLEAGAMAKPIITTNSVGCKEVVDEGINGFLCEPKKVSSLVEELEKVVLMPYEERIEMGLKSREKMEREFDEKIVIRKYLDAIHDILSA